MLNYKMADPRDKGREAEEDVEVRNKVYPSILGVPMCPSIHSYTCGVSAGVSAQEFVLIYSYRVPHHLNN